MAILTKKKDDFSLLKEAGIRHDEKQTTADELKVIEDDRVIGSHVFGNLYRIDKLLINDVNGLKKIIEEAVGVSGMQLVEIKSWPFGGKKGGVTVVAVMQETGHIALHTWNEYGYATLDIYTSGTRASPNKAFDYVVGKLRPKRHQKFNADRSQIDA